MPNPHIEKFAFSTFRVGSVHQQRHKRQQVSWTNFSLVWHRLRKTCNNLTNPFDNVDKSKYNFDNPRTNFEHSYADFKLTLHQHGLTEPLTRQSNDWIWFKQKPLFMFVGALVKLKIDCNLLKVHVGS